MSKNIFRRFLYCLLALAFIVMLQSSRADEVIDHRYDQSAYGKAVAEINSRYTVQSDGRKSASQQTFTSVITFGASFPIDFSNLGYMPVCEVYGPHGCGMFVFSTYKEADYAVKWMLTNNIAQHAEIDMDVHGSSNEAAHERQFTSWGARTLNIGEYKEYAQLWGNGGITVAVVDSGVYRHSFIAPVISALGYDYVDCDYDPTNDLNGHGTHVAGIITDCAYGVPVYIYPIRVLDASNSGKMSNVVSAIMEAVEAHVDVINLSLSTSANSEVLESTIRYAVLQNVGVVVAAGNYACDAQWVSPARMKDEGVVVVGSVESDGSLSSYSNYGESVDVYVYGTGINSCSISGGYSQNSGTSMAAPHVTALYAMIKLVHQSESPADIENRIKKALDVNTLIPDVHLMIPEQIGFHLLDVHMCPEDVLQLPLAATPLSACESIVYSYEGPMIEINADGQLIAMEPGMVSVMAHCTGFEDIVFSVTVENEQSTVLMLPTKTRSVGTDVFRGNSQLTHIIIPESVKHIGERTFEDCEKLQTVTIEGIFSVIEDTIPQQTVLICRPDSQAYQFAAEHEMQYILVP